MEDYMSTTLLNDILKEYEKIRIDNSRLLEKRKAQLFSEHPEIGDIVDAITNLSIQNVKLTLLNPSSQEIEKNKIQLKNLSNKKIELLNKFNKSNDYLNPIYTCPLCKDTGYVTDENYKSTMCSCLKQKLYDKDFNKVKISNQNFSFFNENLYSDEINEKKYFTPVSPRENILDIKSAVEDFIENFDDLTKKNLIFTGGTGLGKTFLSNCIVNELLKKGKTVMYQTAPVMLDSLIADLFSKPGESKNLSEDLLSVDLLVIDDLGTETMNSMKFTELYKIINTRLLSQNGKTTKTIISTNLDLKSMLKVYDERLISRFVGYYDVYRFYGEDIRFKK